MRQPRVGKKAFSKERDGIATGQCLCGKVQVEINLPRALFDGRTGREPLYHIGISEAPEWAYRQETLKPLKGYPSVMWTGARRRKRRAGSEFGFVA